MKIYIVKQTIEMVSGFELDTIITNLYGAYMNIDDAMSKVNEISLKLLDRGYELIQNEEYIGESYTIVLDKKNKEKEMKKKGVRILYKGNHFSKGKTNFIEIIHMKVKPENVDERLFSI